MNNVQFLQFSNQGKSQITYFEPHSSNKIGVICLDKEGCYIPYTYYEVVLRAVVIIVNLLLLIIKYNDNFKCIYKEFMCRDI